MKKINLVFVVIGLAVGLFSGFKLANRTYRAELKEGRDRAAAVAINSTNPTKKASEIEAVITKARNNPGDYQAQLDAAEQFLSIQRADGSVEFLNRALQIKPNDPDALASLGEVSYVQQKFDDAINYSRRALKERPGLPIAQFYLMASLVETRQNLDEAEKLLGELERLRPGDKALQQVRQIIQSSKSGPSGSTAAGKSVLAHGPEESEKKPR